jgi:hypothetical protein
MRYLRSPDLELVLRIASETVRRRHPRRAARPRAYVLPTIPVASRVRAYVIPLGDLAPLATAVRSWLDMRGAA